MWRLLPLVLLSACATMSVSAEKGPRDGRVRRPVILVHGIDDDSRKLVPLRNLLGARGWREVELLEFKPNDGSSGLPALAQQLDARAAEVRRRTGSEEVDVVAFSMGALVTRYWLRRTAPSVKVGTFVSISGPHHGTLTGWLRFNDGAKQMRSGSDFVKDLERDEGEWGGVRVFTFWSPMDLMILPAGSSRLKGAVERTFPVIAHPLMMFDARVLDAVAAALEGGVAPARPLEDTPGF